MHVERDWTAILSSGVRVSIHAPWISHLLFADDCLVFAPATKRSVDRVAAILHDYHRGSGQLVNKQKSAIFYSDNCQDEEKAAVHDSLEIETEALGEKYLGLPTSAGKVSDGVFDYILGRVRQLIAGWGGNLLSCAGREVLIKANAQAVPTYPMSCFKLPAPICKKMTTYISNYWWGSSIDNHKIHWLKWNKMTDSKMQGGMGFRDMPMFNQAMFGKQGWRLLPRPDALCTRVFKGKYYPYSDFLAANRKRKSSETWKALRHGREVLKKGLVYRIGLGSMVDIWNDNWLPGIQSLKPRVRLLGVELNKVEELLDGEQRVWKEDLVRQSFIGIDVEEILKIKPSQTMDEDVLAWAPERSGVYSVRSAYRLLKADQTRIVTEKEGSGDTSSGGTWWKRLAKLKVPPKVRIFWWRVIRGFLPCNAEMKRRQIRQESHCDACGNPAEDLYHVLVACPWARRFWSALKDTMGKKLPVLHPATWTTDVLHEAVCSKQEAALFVCGC